MSELITPLVDEGLGNSSYLVDLGDGHALAVDANRDPGQYLAVAERRGLRVTFAVETHLHADFVSGSAELAAHGASILAPATGHLELPHRPLSHGDEIDLGGLTLRALATPGHTPEHLAYLLMDGSRPVGLFSGGSLLVDSMARTDLIEPDDTEELTRALWRSIHEQLLVLPDDVVVYPTHGAGSFCSSPAGGERITTIGRERAANPLLAAPDEDTFVKRFLGELGSYPTYFSRLREVNRRGPKVYGSPPPPLEPLDVHRVRELVRQGAVIVDARPIAAFARGHVPGSISIALRDSFASWLGWLVLDDVPLVFVLEDDQDRGELVRQALNVGYEHLAGELAGGMAAWRGAGLDADSIPLVGPTDVADRVIDVRQDAEWASGHLPHATHVELGDLGEAQAPDGPVTMMCAHGERAMTGASVLTRSGRRDVSVLVGGADDWATATGTRLARS